MSLSRASRAAVPLPDRCSRLTGPISLEAGFVLTLPGRGTGCGVRAGTGLGWDRTGSTVRGAAVPGNDGRGVAVAVVGF